MTFKLFLSNLQKWWLLVLLFAIPLSLKYVTKEPFAISWLNLLSLGFIGLGFVNLLFGVVPYQPIRHKPFVMLLLVFVGAMLFGTLFTPEFRNAIGLLTSRLFQPLLVGFFAYQLLANSRVTPAQCVKALFWSLVPLLILGVMQVVGMIDYRDPGRITGPYFYPNTFARYMDILLLVTLPWILFGLPKGKRLALGIWGLGLVLLLSSKSYNGALTLWAGLITILLLLPASFAQLKRVGVISLVVLAVLVAVNAPRLPKWETSITDSRLTRLEFWDIAGKVIQDNFWTGIGIKTWELKYPEFVEQYGPFPPHNWGSVQPHNVFLDSMLKAGILGLFAVTALLLWPILQGVALARRVKENYCDWWVGMSLAAYGVGMLVFGLIDDPIWSDDTMPLLFVLYFVLAFAATRLANDTKSQS